MTLKHDAKGRQLMGLFDAIAAAIENPNLAANSDQLASVLGTVQQLAGQSAGGAANQGEVMPTAIAVVSKYVKSGLQAQRQSGGNAAAQTLVEQFSGTQPNANAVSAVLSAPQVAQLTQELEQRTGLEAGTIQNLLPTVVPLVLQMLQTGSTQPGTGSGDNAVLGAFLDSDGDGDVDMADALQMASRYLN